MERKVYTAEEYKKMMQKHKKKNAKAKIKARTKGQGLSNDVKCKIVTTIGVIVITSAVTFAGSMIGRLVLYGSFVNSKTEPERIYVQDENVPAGYFNEHPIKIAVSSKFSQKEFEKIESAINKLDGYAEGIKFEIVRTSKTTRNDDEQIIILKDTQGKYLNNNENGVAKSPKVKDSPEDYYGTIYFNKDVSINIVEKLTMHEILHILDFEHENDLKSIMFAGSGKFSTPPTKKDIENINIKFPAAEQEQ